MKPLCIIVLLVVVALGGCNRDDSSEPLAKAAAAENSSDVPRPASVTSNESARVTILPHSPTARDELRVVASGGEIGHISWYRDGLQIPDAHADVLPSHSLRKGEEVSVEVATRTGTATASKVIGNTPPEVIAVDFADPQIRSGEPIEVVPEGMDEDGDPLDFRFVWVVNGNVLPYETGPALSPDHFRKGDRILLRVSAFDGETEGSPFLGDEFVIPNSPPAFRTDPPADFTGGEYAYEVRADDPDGDSVRYRLENGPPGMKMDLNGKISWSLEAASAGDHQICIVAEDDEGAWMAQEYTLRIAFQEE